MDHTGGATPQMLKQQGISLKAAASNTETEACKVLSLTEVVAASHIIINGTAQTPRLIAAPCC
jgi:hypothetical protein